MLGKDIVATREQQLLWVEGAKRGIRSDAEKLLKSIRRFLYAMTKGYTHDPDMREDLYSEACYAVLCYAVPKFDPGMGFTFLSYAVFWARSYMSKYFEDNMAPIRIPANLVKFYRRAKAGKGLGATRPMEKEIATYDFMRADAPTKLDERETIWDRLASASDGEIDRIFSKDYLDKVFGQLSDSSKETARTIQEMAELELSRAAAGRMSGISRETLRQREKRLVKEASLIAKKLNKEQEGAE